MTTNRPPGHDYVEELRATGFHGREPWVASLDHSIGTALAALRQMEVCAEQMASVCLDAGLNDMDNLATWELIRASFLPRFTKLTEQLENLVPTLAIRLGSSTAPPDDSVLVAWHALKSLDSRLHTEDQQTVECAEIVLPLLFAVIALQDAAHRAVNPSGNANLSGATQLSAQFLQRCRLRLGWPSPRAPASGPLEQFSGPVGASPASG